MPLLSKNRNDNTATDTTTGGGRHHHGVNPNNTAGGTYGTGTGTGPGPGMTGAGYDTGYPAGQPVQNMGPGQNMGTGIMGQQGHDGTDNFGQGQYTHGMSGPGYDNANTGPNMTGPNTTGIPSAKVIDHNGNNTSGGAGSKLTGKIESAIGSMVGSSALKNKGLQKQQEANAAKMQSTELAEAERLEREAMMRRERAVAHGAHPANSQLGAGHTARENQDTHR